MAGVAAPRQTRGQQAAAPLLLFAQLNDRAATGVGATPQAEAVLQRKRDWLTSLWDSLDDKSAVQLAKLGVPAARARACFYHREVL